MTQILPAFQQAMDKASLRTVKVFNKETALAFLNIMERAGAYKVETNQVIHGVLSSEEMSAIKDNFNAAQHWKDSRGSLNELILAAVASGPLSVGSIISRIENFPGVSVPMYLGRLVAAGKLVRISRGVYALPEHAHLVIPPENVAARDWALEFFTDNTAGLNDLWTWLNKKEMWFTRIHLNYTINELWEKGLLRIVCQRHGHRTWTKV